MVGFAGGTRIAVELELLEGLAVEKVRLQTEFVVAFGDVIRGKFQTGGFRGAAFQFIRSEVGDIFVDPCLCGCFHVASCVIFGAGVFNGEGGDRPEGDHGSAGTEPEECPSEPKPTSWFEMQKG